MEDLSITLKAKLEEIDAEIAKLHNLHAQRRALIAAIRTLGGEKIRQRPRVQKDVVVDLGVELAKKLGRPVRNKELTAHVEENGHAVDLEYKTQSLGATVSAMLSAEFKKSDSRLIRVGRGVYNLRGS